MAGPAMVAICKWLDKAHEQREGWLVWYFHFSIPSGIFLYSSSESVRLSL